VNEARRGRTTFDTGSANAPVIDAIYRHPQDYDLEHDGDGRDVEFYRQLVARLDARRVLELACGSGRLTLPLGDGAAAHELGEIVGVELSEDMLNLARRKLDEMDAAVQRRIRFEAGDMRTWSADRTFDLVLLGCSTITHLLTLEDRLAVWRRACQHLAPGGRFIVDVTMPDIRMYAASLESPPRALVEIDLDRRDESSGERLLRSKTTTYDAFTQRASIRFIYDKFAHNRPVDRYVSDFESYVYSPSELRLLFMCTGFDVEAVWADYRFREPRSGSREIIMVGRRR
jgi:SAM-dependent methyltransferase